MLCGLAGGSRLNVSTYVVDSIQTKVTVMSPECGCDGESHVALEKAVTVDDCDVQSVANGDGRCATVALTLFDSQCSRSHNLSKRDSLIADE